MANETLTKYFIIINPVAGNKKNRPATLEIEAALKLIAINYTIAITSGRGDAKGLAKKAIEQGYNTVVAAGGDGTINEVASALIGTQVALGIIPLGSGNGLARHLKIPIDIAGAIDYIVNAKSSRMDVIQINNHYSFNVSGYGFDALIAHRFEKATQRGYWGYLKIILKEILRYPLQQISLIDSKNKIDKKVFLCAVANSSQFGNDAIIAPHASINDGLVNIVLLTKIPLYKIPVVGYKLMNGTIDKAAEVISITTDKITMQTTSNFWHIDGEAVEIESPVNIKVIPSSLIILTL